MLAACNELGVAGTKLSGTFSNLAAKSVGAFCRGLCAVTRMPSGPAGRHYLHSGRVPAAIRILPANVRASCESRRQGKVVPARHKLAEIVLRRIGTSGPFVSLS